jgi:two-component system chemotaxis sensor kinase CheA
MENVFELLRQRKTGLPREAIDVLLGCLDALEAAVDAIDADGSENLDPAPLIANLQQLIRDRDADDDEPAATASAGPVSYEADGPVVVVRATLADDAMMPAVRAFQVMAALGEHGRIVHAVPDEEALDDFGGTVIEAWVETDHEPEALIAAASSVADIASVTAEDAPAPGAVEEVVEDEVASITAIDEPRDASAHAKKPNSSTVRVDADRLDVLMHLVGELVVHRTHVESLASQSSVPGLAQAVQDLTRSSQALQAMVMQVRMIPVDAVFLRFPRLVRDLSSKLDKKVELVLSGRETELDRTVVDALGDPLVHLVRNSLDHGIESPADRLAAGKPETATLEISARHAGGNVEISVSDDGRGIDTAAVARKALERGLITAEQVEGFDMRAAIEVLFAAGFSTSDVTSDISGRGVGMDAVRTTIRELGGEVIVTSTPGEGTLAQIRLPLTLAIMSTLLVEAAGCTYAIPLDRVERTLRIADHVVRSVAGRPMLVERDSVFPIVNAARALGHVSATPPKHAVLVRSGDKRIALAVEQLIGQRELVTRRLPAEIASTKAVSGGAVLSDGSIALIVDCDSLSDPAVAQAA